MSDSQLAILGMAMGLLGVALSITSIVLRSMGY